MRSKEPDSRFEIPSPPDEGARLKSLHAHAILDTPPETVYDDLARLAAHVCETPMAAVGFVDDSRQWFKAELGIGFRASARSDSFCTHTIRQADPLIVPDAAADPRFAHIPMVTGPTGVRSYAGIPLESPPGIRLGALAVFDRQPRVFRPDQIDMLQALARQAMSLLELRLQRRTLEETAGRLGVAQEIAQIGSWEMVIDENRLIWSPEVYRILGVSPTDFRGTSQAFFEYLHPEDRPAMLAARTRTLAGEGPLDIEHRIIRPDGTIRHVHERARLLEADGVQPRRLSGTVQDITERRKAESSLAASEERFRLLSKATNDAIWDWDLATNNLWWNEGFETLFGYLRSEIEPSIDSWTSRIHPEDRDPVLAAVQAVIASGGERYTGEYRFRRKDGAYAHVVDRGYIIRDTTGKPVRMIGGMTDDTERKRIERQSLRAQRMESIGTLAGGIAHDLNNVLAPILMSVDLLELRTRDEEDLALLATVKSCSQRGADLVKQVLSFARGIEGERIRVNPTHMLEDIGRMVRETFPKDITFHLHASDGIWPVIGDPTQLHQVFMNLCLNARDAMPHGGRLSIRLENLVLDEIYAGMHPESHSGPHVAVTITDTGIGISREVQDRIFEPFFTTKEVGKGTGLGLSTTLAIVRSHGGFINVYSESGRGAAFKVHLPARATPESAEGTALRQTGFPRGNGQLILVVDDEESIRTVTRKTLERFGYRVLLASQGAEAVALYAQRHDSIDLVLTDMAMPVMDGPATIIALRAINPRVRIVGCSGLSSSGGVAKAIGTGIEHFVPKPYTAEVLLRVIHQALEPSSGTAVSAPD